MGAENDPRARHPDCRADLSRDRGRTLFGGIAVKRLRAISAAIEHHAGLLSVIGLGLLSGFYVSQLSHNATLGSLRVAQLRSCHRLNVQRAEMNKNWLIAYGILAAHGLAGEAAKLRWLPLT